MQRRTFIKTITGLSGAVAGLREDSADRLLAANRKAANRSPREIAADEDFWFEIQQAFTVDRTIINLNNGGVSPSPRVVQDAMRRYLEYSNQAPAYTMWQVLEPQIEGVRRRLAAAFGCEAEEIAVTRNASEALETCQFGLDLKPGDEVLTTTQDYPRMLTTWRQRVARDGIVLKTLTFPTPPPSLDDLLERFEKSITPRTRAIMVCHITNLTGQIFPIQKICRMARARGIAVIVDGAHAFAHFPFQHADLDCDYYGTSLHKWLLAPHGTGFLYVRQAKIPDLWPLMAAPAEMRSNIRKFEEIGTHPAANHNAIAEALTFYEGIGAARKAERLRYLRNRWADRLSRLKGARLLTSLDATQSCGLATISFAGTDPHKLAGILWEKHRILVTAIVHEEFQGLRITPNVYTTPAEIDTFCAAMEKAIL